MVSIGYIRVSTQEQDPSLQRDAMAEAGIEKVFEDLGVSGTVGARPSLDAALEYLRPGDVLVVWRLDRLGRRTARVLTLIQELSDRGVGFRSLTEQIDTSGPLGKVLLALIAAFSELERDVLIERTRAGLDAARARGRVGGRPRALTPAMVEVAQTMSKRGAKVAAIAGELGVSRATVYRALDRIH